MANDSVKPNSEKVPTGGGTQDLVPDLLARRFAGDSRSQFQIMWDEFKSRRPAYIAFWVMIGIALIGVFSPLIANHRPFLLHIPEDVAVEIRSEMMIADKLLPAGLQFPLFSMLRVSDWILLFGFILLVLTIFTYRRARKRKLVASRPLIGLIGLASVVPLFISFFASPGIQRWRQAGEGDEVPAPWTHGVFFFEDPRIGWALLAIVGVLGAILFARHAYLLYIRKRDDFGQLTTGRSLTRCFLGGAMIIIVAGNIGTLRQREIDPYDYWAVAQADDQVMAIFPIVKHGFEASEFYRRNQPPGGPFTRVHPAGGSSAAADLGLTDFRRDANLSEEVVLDGFAGELTPDLPLASLRSGEGVRVSAEGGSDFTVVSHGGEKFKVSIGDAETLGEVFSAISDATDGTVTAVIDSRRGRIELEDANPRGPRNFMGTDDTGSDVAARLLYATRVAVSIGFVSTGIAILIGITVGALMGYFGGWVDIIGMRIIEIFMAIPRLFLLLTIIAFIPPEWNKYMLYAMMAVIGMTSWMGSARFIRAEFFKLRNQDYVLAARACGLSTRSILFRHMLPNGVTPVLVQASFGVAAAIFVETGLSFLGFGIKPPNPSWGQMLSRAVDPTTGVFNWWLAVFPGILIFLTVFGFNLIGDALRDAIDPKLKKQSAI